MPGGGGMDGEAYWYESTVSEDWVSLVPTEMACRRGKLDIAASISLSDGRDERGLVMVAEATDGRESVSA